MVVLCARRVCGSGVVWGRRVVWWWCCVMGCCVVVVLCDGVLCGGCVA